MKSASCGRKFLPASIAVLAWVALFAGSARSRQAAPASGGGKTTSEAEPTMREVTDEVGRRVRVSRTVERIVSLAPNLTEIVYALGAADRLAGVTNYCDFPPEAQKKPRVGGAINPSLEKIAALRPDLVLATRSLNRLETVEALERMGLAVYVTYAQSVEGTLESIEHIAELIEARETGEGLVARLRARLEEVRKRLAGQPPKRVLFIVWEEPLISAGQRTFLGDALGWAGAESVVQTTQEWPRVSLEEVVRLQPDYLIFAASPSESAEHIAEKLRGQPGWRDLRAVQQGHIVVVSDALNKPAPRLVDAIEELARQLHPEAFRGRDGTRRSKTLTSPLERSEVVEMEHSLCGR
jgi:cobalamin transport system substrate-binding protein